MLTGEEDEVAGMRKIIGRRMNGKRVLCIRQHGHGALTIARIHLLDGMPHDAVANWARCLDSVAD